MAELLRIADELYAMTPSGFTAERDRIAKATPELRTRIKALKKPSVSAWAVNLLVRRESEQIEQVLGVAVSLREAAAAMDGQELRALTRQRRQLTTALATAARRLAHGEGVRLTAPVVDQIEGMLNAAMLDPDAAAVVRSGLVIKAFTSTGLGSLDVESVLALPEAIGFTAGPVEAVRPALSVVPEDDGVRRARAQDELEQAETSAQSAAMELAEIEESLARLDARRLQVAEEIDEVKRRLAALETDLDEIEDDVEEGEAARDEARVAVAATQASVDSARARLVELGE